MKSLRIMVATIIMALGFVMPVAAATVEETRVKCKKAELEYEIFEDLMEEEKLCGAIDFTVEYEEIGKGIYDICLTYIVYTKHVYEFHWVYDAVEDDDLTEYGIYNGRRYTSDDITDMFEIQFPELMN